MNQKTVSVASQIYRNAKISALAMELEKSDSFLADPTDPDSSWIITEHPIVSGSVIEFTCYRPQRFETFVYHKHTPLRLPVDWGVHFVPESDWIDPQKTYQTRDGRQVIGIKVVLYNACKDEVTFPVKGSILRPNQEPKYRIWTLDGRADLFKSSSYDLIKVEE